MFETVQIARRHLLRFEYPQTEPAAPDADTGFEDRFAPALEEADGVSTNFRRADEDEPSGATQDPLYCWALFPYY